MSFLTGAYQLTLSANVATGLLVFAAVDTEGWATFALDFHLRLLSLLVDDDAR